MKKFTLLAGLSGRERFAVDQFKYRTGDHPLHGHAGEN
jgi:hypothetical protein